MVLTEESQLEFIEQTSRECNIVPENCPEIVYEALRMEWSMRN
jgi:hypothetical protein